MWVVHELQFIEAMKKTQQRRSKSPLKTLRLEDLKAITGGEEASLELGIVEKGTKEKECKAGDEKICKQITRPQ